MIHEQKVQVVLGEAERTDGLLRFVLEGEGFDIVGLASNDQELLRVVTGARPDVVVLDAGISAPAAMEVRTRVNGAPLVVVWPDGVAAVLAEERVDPFDSISDLGDAVRRAAERAELRRTSARVPVATGAPTIAEDRGASVQTAPIPARSRGRRGQLVIAAATWMVALTALTAIAIAVPNAMDPFPRHGGGRPSSSPSVTRGPDERTASERTGDTTGAPGRTQSDSGRKDKGKEKGKDKVRDRGRPDDPGSQADGRRSSNQEPRDGGGEKKVSPANGGDEPANGGDETGRGNTGDAGKTQEHNRAASDARTERGNSG